MAPQDSFIEEEEDVCPLCIEEFDLSDRNFRPCPCGYQVCQFCFNNIKNNMNGLCPACRRPYDEKTIEWKVVTQEEVAEFRANIQKNQKKRAQEQRHKEVQKRETEKENRKNLVGVRVVQKNLVYITGLAPTVREDELLKTLRKPEFFGQYGTIQKISISNRKSPDGQHHSLGIYVTFEKPEEATKCIQAVHGSQNGDRILKAQHGTTKYCSAWLKNEKCSNPGCMFLHEQGDEEDSYTRQDLSSMNSIHTQRPLPGGGASSSRTVSRQQGPQPTPPPPSVAVAAQPMARTASKEGSDNGVDSSALPSSANWARNPQRSRRGSYATSGAASSPAISMSQPARNETAQEVAEDAEASISASTAGSKGRQHQQSTATAASESTQAEARRKKDRDSDVVSILKALESFRLPVFNAAKDYDYNANRPMFDPHGGEKRRAMREDEESRLDQEDHAVTRVPTSDGEPETGGSLALGGEPEDREVAADGHGFDQRQPGTQPPIQRGSMDALYGSGSVGSGFPQAPAGLGRSMTPQQLAALRTQSGFSDQMPPGISAQNVFQSPGHNRQSSRFSFANETNNATSNIKLAANPRIMAQQSSMMPSAFQSQNGNQFYGTSMPGPPPGLKSTGTPPSMFGQGFGAGSGFGGALKDSSTDLLQTLIGRNRGSSTQPPDMGKREYMISSFSNQYPPSSTSTPAPASGLLASLYGNPSGAFQDFGSKQKRKGKKHRHANTSSSGGSGLVDLADPSILQARMQHQSQGNAGVTGQGLFGGGQSQDDELPSLDEATLSVDALVSDEPQEVSSAPGLGFEPTVGQSIPPGFSMPQSIATSLANSPRSSMPSPSLGQHRQPSIVPALPKVQPPPGLERGAVTPEQTPRKRTTAGADIGKKNMTVAVETTGSTHISSQRPVVAQKPSFSNLQDEDFPALGSHQPGKTRPAPSATPMVPTPKSTPAPKKGGDAAADKRSRDADHIASSPVANLSTQLNAPASRKAVAPKDTPSKKGNDQASEVSSRLTALPRLTTNSPSPSPRPGPRTLRVMSTPKSIEAPTLPSPMQTATSKAIFASHGADTPLSEMASDTASMLSASVSASRAGSPPPSKVGSAAIRSTTKSQQRKQRKEVLKQETKIIAETLKADVEEHAPVIGRKKKQKKDKPTKFTAVQSKLSDSAALDTTPATSEIASPSAEPDEVETKSKAAREQKATGAKGKDRENDSEREKEAEKERGKGKGKSKGKEGEKSRDKAKDKTPPSPGPTSSSQPAEGPNTVSTEPIESADPAERQQFGPASVFAEIRGSLWTTDLDKLQMLKPVSSTSSRPDQAHGTNAATQSGYCKECACKCGEIQEADLVALRAGKPVRKQFHVDGSRMLITPNGDCIRGLTPEEEDAFLDLQSAIAATADNPGAFMAPRHQPGTGAFSLIKGRAVPNGRPNIFPATAQPNSQDPIGKLQREDALSYINQYVLPRLNLDAANMGFPKGASPLRDAAAASLNALAPYFYGPDAAAGVGIYSAPDGARAMQDFSSSGGAPAADVSKIGPANGLGGISLMSVEDAEARLTAARRETEKLEKGLNAVIKRNRRLLLGSGN
ncbi:hypothetical protein E4U43_007362 [Claviceps pusilla]|uniref:Uncharacterized protein n=1 Tax=Claviceps pusilla TaxID=123648 RepID=A0A9P7NCQ7_9HYPO|nr:hypothetical protein E4U43_007362 [Claviceps pusilla]